ncbi:HlyC/CorC family transporter [Micrococcales bacterium 31B]|nr:HlyC/CorC family transporter [Micrococcales bacterium 31B]
MTEALLLLAGVFLTLCTAVFVAAEFSLVALDRHTIESAIEQGDRRAVGVLKAHKTLSTQLSGAQVGITVSTLLFGFAVQPPLQGLLSNALGGSLSDAAAATLAGILAMAIAYTFSMVFGELIPKNLAIAVPLATAKVAAPLQRGFTTFMKPFIYVLNGSANGLLRAMGVEPQEELSAARSPAELESLVMHSAEAGTLDAETADLFTRSLDVSARTASDVMTHRGAMHVVAYDDSVQDLTDLTRATGKSRFPVTGDSIDDIIGVAQVRSCIGVPLTKRGEVQVSSIKRPILQVPESLPVLDLLERLRGAGSQMAIVVDEYGGTAGLVTLEDVVEEIVGEISDEHDSDEIPEWEQLPDGRWRVQGLVRPDQMERVIGFELPDSPDYETLGGLVMAELDRIPAVGDSTEIRVGSKSVTLTVDSMDKMRVSALLVAVHDAPHGDDNDKKEASA